MLQRGFRALDLGLEPFFPGPLLHPGALPAVQIDTLSIHSLLQLAAPCLESVKVGRIVERDRLGHLAPQLVEFLGHALVLGIRRDQLLFERD